MKTNLFQLMLIAIMVCCTLSVQAKPSSSLTVRSSWLENPVVGQVSEFQVVILSGMSTKKLLLEIALPRAVSLVEGQQNSVVEVKRGEAKTLLFKVMINENPGPSISVSASIGQRGKAFYSANSELWVSDNAASSLKPRNKHSNTFKQTERNGVKIREYQIGK